MKSTNTNDLPANSKSKNKSSIDNESKPLKAKPSRSDPDFSRSEQKRDIQDITKLGQRLLALPRDILKGYPLSDHCLKALLDGQKITSPISRNRQVKYIGKLLREEDLAPVHQRLLLINQEKHLENKQFHQLEQWRDRLVHEGDKAIFELLQQEPKLDRQHLRQLVRNAQSEIKNNKPPKFQRLIFQFLKDNAQQ